jgi:hypothetical protein
MPESRVRSIFVFNVLVADLYYADNQYYPSKGPTIREHLRQRWRLGVVILLALILAGYWVEGTGFGDYCVPSTATQTVPATGETTVTTTEQYQRGTPLWA